MKIKRYMGKTTNEAMHKLKRELGTEAIILHTRKIKHPGLLGFFKKPLIEVVAALDDEKNNHNTIPEAKSNKVQKNNYTNNLKPSEAKENFTINREDDVSNISTEISNIKKLLVDTISNIESSKSSTENSLPDNLIYFRDKLVSNGVERHIAIDILSKISNKFNINNKDVDALSVIIKQYISSYLGEPSPIELDNNQKVVFFVGPTGVGKTTTLAKIAASFILKGKENIGLITADTYRIAAVQQLKTYSEILNIPLKVLYEVEEIYSLLSNFKDKDIILVDTAGRSHKSKENMEQINALIDSVSNKEVYLVLNATTDISIIRSIVKQYDFIDNLKIIFTKIDESENIGVILNTKYYFNIPISYITIGQNVPEDIQIADIQQLSGILIGE